MFNKKIFLAFYHAISNEISVEENVLSRIQDGQEKLDFVPVRVLKTLPYIKKYQINKFVYLIFCIFFIVVSPIYFLLKLFKNIDFKSKKNIDDFKDNIVLVANGRVDYLYSKIKDTKNVTYININQPEKKDYISIYHLTSFLDFIKAYFYAIWSVAYIFTKLKDKTNICQTYAAYEWFLTYIVLSKIANSNKTVYFANHYDRWATLFDQLFKNDQLILLQHGVLPKGLNLAYKLTNINIIYAMNKESIDIFKKMFNCPKVSFNTIDMSLPLQKVKANKPILLVIGQPHSIDKEIEIINTIKKLNKFQIYVKPHPLYPTKKYEDIDDIILLKDKSFFPKVNVALCYESTLGLEYEASGVQVIWWKGKGINEIINNL